MLSNKLFFYSVTILIILICLEFLARSLFFVLQKDIKAYQYYPGRYQKSTDLGYELTPNWELNHDTLYEKFNSHGFRSPEFSQIKADDHYRIIITGSSIVYGRTSNQYTISTLLENKLNELYGKTKTIEVINAGVPGYNSFHILRQFDSKLKCFSPDLIINYQFFTDLSIIGHGNNILSSGEFINPNDMRFKKYYLKYALDKSYLFTMFKIAFKTRNININNNQRILNTKEVMLNEDGKNPVQKIYKTRDQLKFYEENMSLLANRCKDLNIDLILCIPISLYKPVNTYDEINRIDNYGNKNKMLDGISTGIDILKEVSSNYKKTYFFKIADVIESEISLFDDKYHTLEKGNDIVSQELKNYIVQNELISK